MRIKSILDKIAAEGGSNAKMTILKKYVDDIILRDIIYQAKSRRVKFYLRQIPEYTPNGRNESMDWALENLETISSGTLRGGQASDKLAFILSCLSPDNAYVVERIIDKDLKIGMGTSNINKVFKGLIEKTPYMGAKSYAIDLVKKIFKDGGIAASNLKMDGRYCNAVISNGKVELESRQGEITHVGNALFLQELSTLVDCVLNGELTIDGLDRYTANGIVASIVDIEKNRQERGVKATNKKIEGFETKHGSYTDAMNGIRYTVWDVITIDEYVDKKSSVIYQTRANRLNKIIGDTDITMVAVVEGVIVTSFEEAMEHFQEMLARGEEGTILKALNGTWKDGKPNWQVKMKLEMAMDMRIIGFNYGTKGSKNEFLISSLQCESDCGIVKTDPAGLTEERMNYITENQDKIMGTIVEVQCSGLSQNSSGDWSTLHPRFMELRDDKDTCDDLASMQEIEDMAKGLKHA